MVLVRLTLTDAAGRQVSDNFYWRGRDAASYQALNGLAPAKLTTRMAAPVVDGADRMVAVTLSNDGAVPALNVKLTLTGPSGARILPAFYSDNYISLLPGEHRDVTIRYPATQAAAPMVSLRGWNLANSTLKP